MNNLTPENYAYFAGMVDAGDFPPIHCPQRRNNEGEQKNLYRFRFIMVSRERNYLKKVADLFDLDFRDRSHGMADHPFLSTAREDNSTTELPPLKQRSFFSAMLPYIVMSKQEIALIIKFRDTYLAESDHELKRQERHALMNQLNDLIARRHAL